jgi:hypothetical protein
MNNVYVTSEFGHGIFTIHFPLILKTAPGVNLMTISPPNFPIAGISPMTGVVEADNLRFTFTLNFKIDLINIPITIPKDYPIMGILPIPRNYCDSFEMVNAYDQKRTMQNLEERPPEGAYFKGMDIKGNKFKQHQLPNDVKNRKVKYETK